jgi:hypothetical protein
MCYPPKYNIWCRLKSITLLLLIFRSAFPQNLPDSTTIGKISSGALLQLNNGLSVHLHGIVPDSNSPLKPTSADYPVNHPYYLDSLKLKTSKNLITRKLYDLVIVHTPVNSPKTVTGESDAMYTEYEGRRIRNITIKRLDVFGSNVRDPESHSEKDIDKLLNKTHINTLESIIRKNLLFKSGDIISPLILSDNERILRELSYIDDARIYIVPVSDEESDILVITKDVYSLGASYDYRGLKKGALAVFDKNIFGMGHELGFEIPFNTRISSSPGFGVNYSINNIRKSFINLETFYLNDLIKESYGFRISRDLLSSTTKYAGGISVIHMQTTEDLGSLPVPALLRYNFHDYWLSRSFLIDRNKVSRVILGARYTHNNILNRPEINSESYHQLQDYRLYLASAAFSVQKYYKASLIYGYGRTEDIPYGGLYKLTIGREFNEFKQRSYFASEVSVGKSIPSAGYFYGSLGLSSYFNGSKTEQGMMAISLHHFTNLFPIARSMVRTFVDFDYTKGFNRYTDEFLYFPRDNGFSGFRNDSITGIDRFNISIESVVFSPANFYGFRFAYYGFADFSFLAGAQKNPESYSGLASIGIGVRIRNNNLLFNTLQIRLVYYPDPPSYSKVSNIIVSGEQLLKPANFDPGPPSVIFYR